ncbi:ABC transporter ATP-binding protein [Candidatus Parcubacteria bacterium]|nr:MAG: ABC transporter ATP-binding protein [Candidatus Parcubacteria bacterium]
MGEIAIRAEQVGKRYQIGGKRASYKSLRESLVAAATAPVRWMRGQGGKVNTFWALRDVSFSVSQGEVVGIIGRNGAGKSTLLKILSRITKPTTGRVRLYGRVGSLLEVGTGFHPELTGRENIFLSGAILGMRRQEIRLKFDEIVDFAEIEKFLDTPVKFYSSGMYVRLAFAVAAHLEPEILLVDEVLAVGDAAFQKKCLGKMGDVAQEGRTVLFVSHRMDAIERLCHRVMLLRQGSIVLDGRNVQEIIGEYLSSDESAPSSIWENPGDEFRNEWFQPLRVDLCDAFGDVLVKPVRNTDEIYLRIEGEVRRFSRSLALGYYLFSEHTRYPIYYSQHKDGPPEKWPEIKPGVNIIKTRIPTWLLNEGQYTISLVVHLRSGPAAKLRIVHPDERKLELTFEINNVANDSTEWIKRKGVIAPILEWTTA